MASKKIYFRKHFDRLRSLYIPGSKFVFSCFFSLQAINSLKDEVGIIPELETAVESGQVVPPERLRFYLDMLENAAVAREAAASRLRAEIRDASLRYPGIFETSPATDSMSDLLCPDYDRLGDSDHAAEGDESELVSGQGDACDVFRGNETEPQASNGIEDRDEGDAGDAAGIVDAGGNGGDPAGAREEETTGNKDDGGGGSVTAAGDGSNGLETYASTAPNASVVADSRDGGGGGGSDETVPDGDDISAGVGGTGVKTHAADMSVEAI